MPSAILVGPREGLVVAGRRGMLKAGLAGIAGLNMPQLLRARAEAAATGRSSPDGKSVILLWMTGGPSHIDTWDVKPDRPLENRGPFDAISTRLPGVQICEHLPKQAAMLDKFTLIRSVDARASNHTPNVVFQTGNLAAEPRTNPEAVHYPALASIVAKVHGPNDPAMPAYVTFMKARQHVAFGGYLGKQFDPFIANQAARLPVYDNIGRDTGQMTDADLFRLPLGLTPERLYDRRRLLGEFDRFRKDLDLTGSMDVMDVYQRQAIELVTGRRCNSPLI